MKSIKTVEDLKAEYLSDVSFVMDYVQLGFSGSTLTVYSRPIAEISGIPYRFPDPGSRDALCSLIGRTLLEVFVKAEDQIILTFDAGRIIILLNLASRHKGDAAEFLPETGKSIIHF